MIILTQQIESYFLNRLSPQAFSCLLKKDDLQTDYICMKLLRYVTYMILSFSAVLPSIAFGVGLTYHGRILKPDGTALEASNVQFTIQIRSPGSESCLLYQETRTIDMSGSTGVFSLSVGEDASYRAAASVDGGFSLTQVFANNGTLTLPHCTFGATYTPNTADGRLLYISFNDGSGPQNLTAQKINFVPYAVEAIQVGGYAANQIMRVDGGTITPLTMGKFNALMTVVNGITASPPSNGQILQYDGTQWVPNNLPAAPSAGTTAGTFAAGDDPRIVNALQNNSVIGGSTSINTTGTIATSGTVSAGTLQSNTLKVFNGANYVQFTAPALSGNVLFTLPSADGTTGQVLKTDGTGKLGWVDPNAGSITNIATGTGLTGGPINSTGTISLADTAVTAGTYGSANQVGRFTVDAQGRLTAASAVSIDDNTKLPLTGGTLSGNLAMGGKDITNIGNITMVANKYFILSTNSTDGTVPGQVWYDSGTIKYFDGSAVKALGVAGAGITNINGLNVGTQSFVEGTSGADFNISSSGSAHTFNIPSSSSSNRGLLTSTDWTMFNNKQSNSLSSAQVWVGNASGGAEARALSGDISISNVGLVTADKTNSGQSNKLLSLDGTGVANIYGAAFKGATSGVITLQAPAITANYTLKFPATAPGAGQSLQSDASGNFIWVTALTGVNGSASLTNGKFWIGNGSGVADEVTMSGDATISNAGLLTLKNTGTVGTYYKVVTDAQGRVTSGSALASADITTALGYTPVNKAGDTMSGDIGTQNINMAANKYLKLSDNTTNGTTAGQIWYDSGTIKYYDGSAVRSLEYQGGTIDTLNGLTSSTQTFATGTSGADFNISSAGSTHTFNIPTASASNRGALSSADWTSFNNKMSKSLTSAQIWVGNASGVPMEVAPSGDATMTNAGAFTVTGLRGKTVSATAPTTAGQVLRYDGTSTWVPNFLSLADIRSTVTPANTMFPATSCTAAQTLTWSALTDTMTCTNIAITGSAFGSQTQNTFLSAPNGSAGNPTFRTIASADLPATGATGVYLNGGNNFATSATLGTNDANSLALKTNNTARLTITSTGEITATRQMRLQSSYNAGASTTIDWNNGNTQYTTANCGAFTFSNMQDGGSYTLVVLGTTSGTCTFSQTSPDTPSYKYSPANGPTVGGTFSSYTFVRVGTYVMVSWISGFQ